MKTKGNKLFSRVASFMLAMVMVLSVFAVVPTEVAAAEKSFKSTGTSSVTLTDDEVWDVNTNSVAPQYIKFKAKNTGYVTIKMTNASTLDYANGYLTFCNSKKKALNAASEKWDTSYDKAAYYTRTFGVKKGQTYYVKIESVYGVKVTATFKKVTKSNNSSKKKAKTLKAKTTAKGVIIAGDKTADWYKIKVTGNKKVKISYTGKTNGDSDYNGIKVSFYDSKGKLYTSNAYDWVSPFTTSGTSKYYRVYSLSGKQTGVEPGTYYIKVERYNKTSSGYYTLKWSTY